MGLKKKLPTGDTIEAWSYGESGYCVGIGIGVFNRVSGHTKAIVNVENAYLDTNRIVINKTRAKELGFEVVIED